MSKSRNTESTKSVVDKLVLTPDQLPPAAAPREPVGEDDRLAELRRYVKDKLCYHPAALANASVISQAKKEAYQVDIYTLMEERSIEWKEQPYANENHPAENVQLFDDHFDIPSTNLESKQSYHADIMRSQNKIPCHGCEGLGHKKCTACFGSGKSVLSSKGQPCSACGGNGLQGCKRCDLCGNLLRWARVTANFYTVHSTAYYQNTFLPENRIRKSLSKQPFFNKDEEWATEKQFVGFASSLSLCDTIKKSSAVEYWLAVEEQYMNKHIKKIKTNTKIRRMQIKIDKLSIIETDYSLEPYVNKRDPSKGKGRMRCIFNYKFQCMFLRI